MSAVVMVGATACGPQGPLMVDLNYAPKEEMQLQPLGSEVLSTPLTIGTVKDGRGVAANAIGENIEESTPIPVVAEPAKIEASVKQALQAGFREAGLQTVEGGATVLNVEVLKLWVSEDNTYNGTARLRVQVMRDGVELGLVVVDGSAKRWGSSLDEENYQEIWSESLLDAVQSLLNSDEFRAVLSGAPAADPSPVEPAGMDPVAVE